MGDNAPMRVPRIYHDGPVQDGQTLVLGEAATAHLTRALRLGAGDALVLFNGDGHDYAARIEGVARSGLTVRIHGHAASRTESPADITLLQGVCRGQRMDLVIQKATELGVSAIVPVLCARTVVRLADDRGERRRAHWQAVAISACEQSGRAVLPTIAEPLGLAEALDRCAAGGMRLLLDPAGSPLDAEPGANDPRITLLIGPEGGLADEERRAAMAAGFTGTRLGPRVLRTETAPLVALSVLQYLWGDLGAPR